MNTIKLNNTTFEVTSYNKSTYLSDQEIRSNATCSIKISDIADVNALMGVTITSLKIYHDETLIYNLADISAKLDNVNEYLNIDTVDVSLSLTFDMSSNS